ncbi:MAG: hypothetical protein V8R83_03710 [Candidatus Gastranaerophilaceae bacterium]|jgi:hypothetical protein|uniref:Uncharacterized protein n=1 Tax=Candidatus Limenecus avicola TaxID=2840847 RepID=A0A9D1N0F2_9CLOT|nr:hypothetical protein [Clostridium sp.]CDC19864.1 unknown [Clostridium sp. CAG:306]HIU92512.1 hypothetical protein [Candidatus Limenecus avicola]
MTITEIQYPALIYKNNKNNVFVANCIVKKLIGFGHSEQDAILNLEKILERENTDFPVKVKPVYKFLPNLVNI